MLCNRIAIRFSNRPVAISISDSVSSKMARISSVPASPHTRDPAGSSCGIGL